MKRFFAGLLLAALAGVPTGPALGQAEVTLDSARIDVRDTSSLQAGARTFVEYCLSCHPASLMRYSRLTDLGFSEPQIMNELMFSQDRKTGQMMDVSMTKADAKSWFGTAPPDLSVIARARGANWLYTFLRSFYRDPFSATGWNNLVFERVGMPHALWQLQGDPVLELREFKTKGEAEASQAQAKLSPVILEMDDESDGRAGTRYVLQGMRIEKPGALSAQQYDEKVRDLVNFLVWMGEPNQSFRNEIGVVVVLFSALLTLLTWFLYKEFWKDVH